MALSLKFINDYPKNRNNGWHEKVQGVTHDGNYWYITQDDRLWRFPRKHDLNSQVTGHELSVRIGDLPLLEVYDHFGDLDHYQGRLYVPLEGRGAGSTPAVAIFRAPGLEFLTYGLLGSQDHPVNDCKMASWCAVNPVDGLLYSSSFNISGGSISCQPQGLFGSIRCDDRKHVYKYDRNSPFSHPSGHVAVGGKMKPAGKLQLTDAQGKPLNVCRVQGGVFSERGNLYLVCDYKDGGIFGFRGTTGKMFHHTKIKYLPGSGEELEGITIWDLDAMSSSKRPPGISGQVHVLMVDVETDWWSADDLYFKHFGVDPQGTAL